MSPNESWKLAEWKEWVRDHVDVHFRTVQVDAALFLAIVAAKDSADDQVIRLTAAWNEERQRI
jgi:hypothetical protein